MALLVGALGADPASAAQLARYALSSAAVLTTDSGRILQGTLGEAGVVGETFDGTHRFQLGFWPGTGLTATAAPVVLVLEEPLADEVGRAFPNPFRTSATIPFSVSRPSPARITVFDVTGRRVVTLLDGQIPAGRHQVLWNGRDAAGSATAAGVYFYRVDLGKAASTRKLLKLH
ncbi:MAG: T9SS type A sorting domain-containing protein [Alphaproteobacteria bacterium]|nr:T9SS type A sorting domain-containing protein [Alphaproteobacteria bacterium]